jgi:uncharacterized membrane protein YhaH (DUF805 family)
MYCFKNYAVFRGRAARPEYWWFYLFTFLGSLIAQFARSPAPGLGLVLIWMWALLTAVPSWAVTSRRLHDTGHSLWWGISTMLLVIPIIGVGLIKPGLPRTNHQLAFSLLGIALAFFGLVIWLLILLSRQGDAGPNRYGDPAPTTPG